MAHTIEELRARAKSNVKRLPTHPQRITLDQELIAQVERLVAEQEDLLVDAQRVDQEGKALKPPRKAAEKARPARLDEIEAELADLYDQIRANEGELLIRAIDAGQWHLWMDEHPAREDSVADEQVGRGLVNTTDLLGDLARYVEAWNGQPLAPGDWDEVFVGQVAPGDLRALVGEVVQLQERAGIRVPKSLSGSSTTESGSAASE